MRTAGAQRPQGSAQVELVRGGGTQRPQPPAEGGETPHKGSPGRRGARRSRKGSAQRPRTGAPEAGPYRPPPTLPRTAPQKSAAAAGHAQRRQPAQAALTGVRGGGKPAPPPHFGASGGGLRGGLGGKGARPAPMHAALPAAGQRTQRTRRQAQRQHCTERPCEDRRQGRHCRRTGGGGAPMRRQAQRQHCRRTLGSTERAIRPGWRAGRQAGRRARAWGEAGVVEVVGAPQQGWGRQGRRARPSPLWPEQGRIPPVVHPQANSAAEAPPRGGAESHGARPRRRRASGAPG